MCKASMFSYFLIIYGFSLIKINLCINNFTCYRDRDEK